MGQKRKISRKSLGAEIVEGLTELHETLLRGDTVEETFTVRKVKLDLKPQAYNARSVQITRARLGVSQALFAQLLGVGIDLVQAWEQGARTPKPMACRLLDEMNLDPGRWRTRLKEAMREKEHQV
jgi:putative transcriptional regulator